MGDVVDISGKKGKKTAKHSRRGERARDRKSTAPHGTQPPHESDGFCGAKKKQGGGTCTKTKGWGTNHVGYGKCKLHGGNTKSGEAAAAKEAAHNAALIMGVAMDIEPHEALLTCVRIAAGEVAYCSTEIANLKKATESTMFGQVLDIWIVTRQKATDRLAAYCKAALAAGVAERQVQIAERYGEMLADLIGAILSDLKLTKDQTKRAPEIVGRHLQALEGGAQVA